MAYGYRTIGGYCISCLTWDEAMEIAEVNANFSGLRHKVIGNYKQHDDKGHNVSRDHQYCYETLVSPEGAFIGSQRANGKARTDSRANGSSS